MSNQQKIQLKYLLPNLFTAGSIFLAVLSILSAFKGEFATAGWYIFLASIFDALDGRVARLTKTTSQFGVEFDSLADVISFGITPAMLYYFYSGIHLGKFGVIVTALFVIFGAVRLARFNVTNAETEPNVFIGLPIPAAGILVVGLVLLGSEYHFFDKSGFLVSILTLFAAVLMVSNIRYPSFKKMDMGNGQFIKVLILIITLLSLIYLYPILMLGGISLLYALFGPLRVLYMMIFRKKPSNNG
ncbi:MAG: CDP-diacylglycerol--serine O-phosphatidyltransferase [Campylobacterales bacterium]|nr:CDP-diacylglycerol--serine O-phosphatidyltransferase [Campylobacterales bacterium]